MSFGSYHSKHPSSKQPLTCAVVLFKPSGQIPFENAAQLEPYQPTSKLKPSQPTSQTRSIQNHTPNKIQLAHI